MVLIFRSLPSTQFFCVCLFLCVSSDSNTQHVVFYNIKLKVRYDVNCVEIVYV